MMMQLNQGLPRTEGITHILLTVPFMFGAVRLSSMIWKIGLMTKLSRKKNCPQSPVDRQPREYRGQPATNMAAAVVRGGRRWREEDLGSVRVTTPPDLVTSSHHCPGSPSPSYWLAVAGGMIVELFYQTKNATSLLPSKPDCWLKLSADMEVTS